MVPFGTLCLFSMDTEYYFTNCNLPCSSQSICYQMLQEVTIQFYVVWRLIWYQVWQFSVRFSCGILDQKLEMKIWIRVWYATLVLFSAAYMFHFVQILAVVEYTDSIRKILVNRAKHNYKNLKPKFLNWNVTKQEGNNCSFWWGSSLLRWWLEVFSNSASCTFGCIWCKCAANDRWDMDSGPFPIHLVHHWTCSPRKGKAI